jgi:hypothetical protein
MSMPLSKSASSKKMLHTACLLSVALVTCTLAWNRYAHSESTPASVGKEVVLAKEAVTTSSDLPAGEVLPVALAVAPPRGRFAEGRACARLQQLSAAGAT